MVALALFAGAVRLAYSFKHYGLDTRLAERYVTAAGISGLLGARLWFIAENWSDVKSDLLGALFSSAGFTFYGGFIIASIYVYLLAKRDGTDIAKFCDSLGPCLALGYAVGRLGCQLSGDGDYGIPTTGFCRTPRGSFQRRREFWCIQHRSLSRLSRLRCCGSSPGLR